MLAKIAQGLPKEDFSFESGTTSTFGETEIEGNFKSGKLTINSTYYPMGYVKDLVCPEYCINYNSA